MRMALALRTPVGLACLWPKSGPMEISMSTNAADVASCHVRKFLRTYASAETLRMLQEDIANAEAAYGPHPALVRAKRDVIRTVRHMGLPVSVALLEVLP